MVGKQSTAEVIAAAKPGGSLLEREHDLAVLGEALSGAAPWRSAVVVIEGPAGIGKTQLLAEGRRLAYDAGARILVARASELEVELAFGVVRQLFEDAVGVEELKSLDSAGSQDASFATLNSLYWLTATLAGDAPVVIAVDDLHWCDEPSLRFLNYLLRRLEGLAVTVLCTLRPRERRARATLVTEIVGDPLATSLSPSPLSNSATARLVSDGLSQATDETFSTACHAATGGNPLLLKELIRTLHVVGVAPDSGHVAAVADLGPRAVSRAVLVRLGRLDDDALRLARAASILRVGTDLPLIAQLAGLDLEGAAMAADALVAAEIFSDDDEDGGFVHPVVGAAVYEDIPSHERSLAHARAARLLRDGGNAAGTVATHLVLAPARGEEWVCDVLEAAASKSLRAGFPAGAVGYLARALSEPAPPGRRAALLLALGGAEEMLDPPSAIEHLTDAFEQGGDTVRHAAAVTLARTLLFNAQADECIALIRRASSEMEPGSDSRLALEALELMAPVLGTGRHAAPKQLRRRGLPGGGAGAKMLAAVVSRQWAYGGESAEECVRLALEALEGGELIAADNVFLSITAILTLVRADRVEADDAWEEFLQESRVRGSLVGKAGSSLWRGYAFLRRGELDDAEDSLQNAVEEFRLVGEGSLTEVHHASFLSAVLRERGDLDRARQVLATVEVPRDASDAARYWLDAHAELFLAEGRYDEARVVAEDMERRFAFLVNPIDTPARSHRAVALFHLGREEEGRGRAAESLELARRWGAPGTVGRALRILGTVERDGGLAHLSEAVAVTEGSVARLEHAKALVALGSWLRRSRRPTEARDPLRRGLELAAALGAGSLVDHARHELRAAGVRPRTTALTGPAALTPAERRVVERAAAGQTNRMIAEALFVTTKTVELHLRNAYRKLGVNSRRELPGIFDAAR
ncbi:MAG: helix-turn-helix transcriptional regulator [Solirubrobacterales bacterium]|nr:helix-turn-helix transcriptional regulator [Solirubrobacterales bacterium]